MKEFVLADRHVVLIGIGHTNAHVVRKWGMASIPGVDLTCISDRPVATYSGMLPAVLAGQIPTSGMEIDLVRLCASVGARLLIGNTRQIDVRGREVHLENHPPVPYDVLSVGIGSRPTMTGVQLLQSGESVLLPIKPMQSFLQRLQTRVRELADRPGARTPRLAVVGGGVAGLEVLFCLQNFLAAEGVGEAELMLVSRNMQVLPEMSAGVRGRVLSELALRNHDVILGQAVTAIDGRGLTLESGELVQVDIAIWATGAAAPDAIQGWGLPQDEDGFVPTNHFLQVIDVDGASEMAKSKSSEGDYSNVFAVGDTGTIVNERLPKAGVYAVRQGPILWDNIQRALEQRQLVPYRPQRSFLSLINLGDGRAIGQWKGIAFGGKWAYQLKHWIDSSFMKKFVPVEMESTEPMQCRGCGCKLAARPLEEALNELRQGSELLADDAARVGTNQASHMWASTDFFSSPFEDAYLAGKVTAYHSMSDLTAMGARTEQGLANVVLPEGSSDAQSRFLRDFLLGAREVFNHAGAQLVGGHTIVGPRFEAGFTVFGTTPSDQPPLAKAGLKPGDTLWLTKPLGIGATLAAHMQSKCPGQDFLRTIDWMLADSWCYAEAALAVGVSAATDVTGFGLAGHLIEMLEGGDLAATMKLAAVPVLPFAEHCVEAGIESSLTPDNLRFASQITCPQDLKTQAIYRLLFDPQTCGGLLLGIAPDAIAPFLHYLRSASESSDTAIEMPVQVGVVHPGGTESTRRIIIE